MQDSIQIWRRIVLMLAVLCLMGVSLPATAQQPTRVNPTADSVTEKQLFDAIKPGGAQNITGRVSIPDSRSSSLIQPAGREWQVWRETTLPRIAAITLLSVIVLLIGFFAVKGRIKIEGGPSGRTIVRFGGVERFGHWLTATAFVVLALTGLNVTFGRGLLLPYMGHESFTAWAQFAKYIHNYMSVAFVIGLVMMFVQWVLFNFPSLNDIRWIARGGGIFGSDHPPAAKFNAGQKIVFWSTIIGGGLLAATGFALMFPFYTVPAGVPGDLSGFTGNIAGIQTVSMLHGLIAVVMIAIIFGHIYIGTIGMQGAFWSMGTGRVDTNWAHQHHSLWADRMTAKSESSGAKPVPAE